MPAPTFYYDWDSEGLNVSDLPVILQTQGYPTDGIPLSADWNAIIKNVVDRLKWLEQFYRTGIIMPTFNPAIPEGWIQYIDGTIGSALSGATVRANADTVNLFTLIWNNVSNANAPVIGGRGLTAAADFEANKQLTLPKANGQIFINYVGAMWQGNPVQLGQPIGEAAHALTGAENGPHVHESADGSAFVQNGGEGVASGSNFARHQDFNVTASSGSGTPHNNIQPSTGTIYIIKL